MIKSGDNDLWMVSSVTARVQVWSIRPTFLSCGQYILVCRMGMILFARYV
jgi:hypothetical protein